MMTTNQKNVLLNIQTRPASVTPLTDEEALELLEQLRILYAYKREGKALAKAIESIKKAQRYEVLHNLGTDKK